jgi:hypothetical protein
MIFLYSRYYHWYVFAAWALVTALCIGSGVLGFRLMFIKTPINIGEIVSVAHSLPSVRQPVSWRCVLQRCAQRSGCLILQHKTCRVISGSASQLAQCVCLLSLYEYRCSAYSLKPSLKRKGYYDWKILS